MKTNRLAAAASTAVMSLGVLVACSPEQGTAPARVNVKTAIFNLAGSSASNGDLIACKTGNAGSFTVVFDAAAAGTRSYDGTQVNGTLTPAGTRTFTFNLAAGECKTLYSRPIVGGVSSDPNVRAVITEAAGPTLLSIVVNDDGSGNEATSNLGARSATLQFNMFHDAMATFNNAPPVTTGCTYTKGWYRNNGSNTIIALADGLTKSQQQQVFNATPGQPGLVTWGADNNNLNLYQQLLAAINNLGGNLTAGPTAVDVAVAAALAGTSVTTLNGGVQITVAAGTDVSGLIDVLSDFNEGSFTGWPHCAD